MSLETANNVLEVLVRTGRAIPADHWVAWLGARRTLQKMDRLF